MHAYRTTMRANSTVVATRHPFSRSGTIAADGGTHDRQSHPEEKRRSRYMEHVTKFIRSRHGEHGGRGGSVELPAESYIGNSSADEFWELIGFRIWGHPYVLLAAVKFVRHGGAMVEHGRESLPFYLSRRAGGEHGHGHSHQWLEVIFPGSDEPIPTFLHALRGRDERPIVRLDPNCLQFAFDFRTVNPSTLSKIQPEHVHPRPTAFRTTEGHVLMGTTKNLSKKLQASPEFLVLLDPVQRTARAAHAMPTLVLQRSFVAASAEAPEAEDDQSLERLTPFSSGLAASRPLII